MPRPPAKAAKPKREIKNGWYKTMRKCGDKGYRPAWILYKDNKKLTMRWGDVRPADNDGRLTYNRPPE